jgi:uncharacterized membrane protein YhfC
MPWDSTIAETPHQERNFMKKYLSFLLLLATLSLCLSGCTSQPETPFQGGSITGVTLNEMSPGQNANFVISVSEAQKEIGLDFWSTLTKGEVIIQVQNKATQEIVFNETASAPAAKFNTVISLPTGEYDLLVVWQGPVAGTYNLEWQPGKIIVPELSPIILMPGIGMLLVGLAFLIYGIRKGGSKLAILGGAFWMGTVIVKFMIAAGFSSPIYQVLTTNLPGLPGTVIFSIYVGLLTGITEILITWLILSKTKLGQKVWKEILSFSLGFGATEAVLLGALSLVSMISALVMTDQIPVSQLRSFAIANNFLYDLAPILERFFTIGVHLGCNVLIFYSIQKKEIRWFWYSFALKSGLDAIAGYAQMSGQLQSTGFIWIIEAFVILFGLVGFWSARYLKPKILALEPVIIEDLPEPALE